MSREAIQAYLHDYLLRHPCSVCGQKDLNTLCFVQQDTTEGELSVSKMLVNRYSVNKVRAVIEKSVVRCFNCIARERVKLANEHRNKQPDPTPATLKKWQNIDAVRSLMGMRGCIDCGTHEQEVLVYDHVRGKKSFGIMAGASKGYSWKRIRDEIKKCEVRCHNCHSIRHQFKEQ